MNTWFQFKEFIVRQDKCAMKVCTDACLFGAVVANKIRKKELTPCHILDIGCGTGLLSLMLSQVSNASVDAVEIEENAFLQAKENFIENNKNKQITAHHNSITAFNHKNKFDLIVCNPPFYEKDLRSASAERNIAMHAVSLTYETLSSSIKQLLADDGKAAILIPFASLKTFKERLSADNIFIIEQLDIRHSTQSAFIRTILICAFHEAPVLRSHMEIRNDTNVYSELFSYLLRPYYLDL